MTRDLSVHSRRFTVTVSRDQQVSIQFALSLPRALINWSALLAAGVCVYPLPADLFPFTGAQRQLSAALSFRRVDAASPGCIAFTGLASVAHLLMDTVSCKFNLSAAVCLDC